MVFQESNIGVPLIKSASSVCPNDNMQEVNHYDIECIESDIIWHKTSETLLTSSSIIIGKISANNEINSICPTVKEILPQYTTMDPVPNSIIGVHELFVAPVLGVWQSMYGATTSQILCIFTGMAVFTEAFVKGSLCYGCKDQFKSIWRHDCHVKEREEIREQIRSTICLTSIRN